MSAWIKEFRKKAGLTQEELAEKLFWTKDKIWRLENGKQKINVQEIGKLGEILEISIEEIQNIYFEELGLSKIKILPKIREDRRFEIETHVAGICIHRTKEGIQILIAKRLSSRELHPNEWECGGGQVMPGENFEEAIKRQMKEEFGIKIKIISVIAIYQTFSHTLPQKIIPGVKFLCELEQNQNEENIQINPREFSDYKWIREDEIDQIDFIYGIKKDIADALRIYKSRYIC